MKLAISTLGCPDWTFDKILETYEKIGVEGIEVRGIEGVMDADKIPYFFPENQAATLAKVKAHGLKFVGFGTSCGFHHSDPKKVVENIAQAMTAVDVCARMGIPAIRVFGNDVPADERREAVAKQIGSAIAIVCRYAKEKGVLVNLEIHGTVNTPEALTPILEIAGKEPAFGILWDVQHSDKTCRDDWESFYTLIKPYVRHIHFKDHLRDSDPPFKLVSVGEGDIPLKAIVDRLLADGYDGYFSLEWEKKWHPDLADPEIEFPHFAELMKSYH